jgi:CrcB protein
MGFLIVFVGGGIGAAMRHGFNLVFARLFGTAFPHATLFENVSGSIVMGMLVALFAFRSGIPQHWQLFLTTGILGGYTTFSTFSLDVAVLYQRGEIGLAALYVLLSVVLSIGGLFGGLALVRSLT